MAPHTLIEDQNQRHTTCNQRITQNGSIVHPLPQSFQLIVGPEFSSHTFAQPPDRKPTNNRATAAKSHRHPILGTRWVFSGRALNVLQYKSGKPTQYHQTANTNPAT
jgi:hypothetical protein